MSEIRALLSAAQRAEVAGDTAEAVRLLQQAAVVLRDSGSHARALQMLRHVRRLEGAPVGAGPGEPSDDDLGFGDSLLPRAVDSEQGPGAVGRFIEARGPRLADPAVEAWCSFCCRPATEVGALVAGPAGAFVCQACVGECGRLLGAAPVAAPRPSPPRARGRPALAAPPAVELPAQAAVRRQLEARRPRLTLLVGPEGAGKTTLLHALGVPVRAPAGPLEGDVVALDVARALRPDEEASLLEWLAGDARRRAVVAVRGTLPEPLLRLRGAAGEEAVYDTASLSRAVPQLSLAALALVDAVFGLGPIDRSGLSALTHALLEARGVALSDDAVERLVDVCEAAGRGAHEVAALVGRIPPGRYD